jgi:hypothetical protein
MSFPWKISLAGSGSTFSRFRGQLGLKEQAFPGLKESHYLLLVDDHDIKASTEEEDLGSM